MLTAVAAAAAALTGLLFVAMSVAPRSAAAGQPAVIRQVRAASSLISFTNVLAVSLFGLIPNDNAGYAAVVVAVIGILFTAASVRSMVADAGTSRGHLVRQAGLVGLLLAAFCFELGGGLALIAHPASTGAAGIVCNVLGALVFIGIARAWELIGSRNTGIFASIAVLAGRDRDTADDDEA
jgi:hypothetical protein